MPDRIIEYSVPADTPSLRADKLFAAEFDDISRARLQRAFDAGLVTFDGFTIDKRFKVNRAGLLRATLKEPAFKAAPNAVDLPLEIIHEDASLLVVNKAPGMVTHPGNGTSDDTLVHALLHHCSGELSSVGAPDRPGIVHRLDKETSGLIIIAKNDKAHHHLAAAFSERNTYKRYTALVLGNPRFNRGTIKEPIARHPTMRTRMAVVNRGKPAHTDWQVETRYGQKAARLSCIIHTGRTHQIRVHMSALRFPLLGDTTYGFKPGRLPGTPIPRVMLHATELRIQHPERQQPMVFNAPLPSDFESVMASLANS
jgi:23S rRNA pseudouridine1911/1915/1917 synthase